MNDGQVREEIATFGGGCFWCIDAVFVEAEGVLGVESGYSGGDVDHPSYADVCSGRTGHAEVIRVRFDPARIGYRDLLEIFFTIHDPTTLNRQGNDVGTQYRSVIYFHDAAQRETAAAVIAELATQLRRPIVTELSPAVRFWPAEDYHQGYFAANGQEPYCQFVVAPKVMKFRDKFAALRRR
ncbi:peptide-methionine (S)-S-oxide reductase MsrA [Derxia lacustris]|uniref:peptide-methionine (S)-S-oxide reductase MsrA n=1 Tax=Derxia lacustris TaxID=764842 RepID=UPI000A176EC0|nr:peptide-methionine (S)-S-oxide reductase MsrA [Derxia lacustris]